MAGTDLLCRLLLNTEQYEKGLKASKEQMKEFESVTNFVKGTVTKFAAGLGIATTGFEALKGIVESNQTTMDMYENTVSSVKGTFDMFMRSIATADFTAFQEGISGTIAKLYDLSSELDDLNDMKLSLGFIEADDMADIRRFQEEARDTSNSITDRINAAQNMGGVVGHLEKKTQNEIDKELKYLNHEYAAKSGLNISGEDLKYFFKNTNFDSSMSKEANATYKAWVSKINAWRRQLKAATEIEATGDDPMLSNRKKAGQLKEQADLYYRQNLFLIKQGWLTEEGDENRRKTLETLKQERAEMENISVLQMQVNKTDKAAHKGTSGISSAPKKSAVSTKKTQVEEPVPFMSLNWYDKRINDVKNELNKAVDDSVRQSLQKTLNDLMRVRKFIEDNSKIDVKAQLEAGPVNMGIKGKTPMSALNDKIKPIISEKAIQTTNQYNDALNGTLSMMTAVGNMTSKGAAGWISYGVNALTSLNSMYQALAKVIPALQVKAIYEGVGSAAETPVVGWVLAIAAMGSMLAAFASMPKYATGGVVGGSSFTGDNILARVNSGEMILTRDQQRALGRELSSASSASRQIDVNVVGRVSGRDLELVLDKRSDFKKYAL